jgi:hypothetical protein
MESYEVEVDGKTLPGTYRLNFFAITVLFLQDCCAQLRLSGTFQGTVLSPIASMVANQSSWLPQITQRRWRKANTMPLKLSVRLAVGMSLNRANARIMPKYIMHRSQI